MRATALVLLSVVGIFLPASSPQTGTVRGVLTEKEKAANRHFARGMQYYEKDRYREACDEWHAALQLDPNHPEAAHRLQEAVRRYSEILARFYRGKAHYAESRYEEAAAEFRAILQVNPYDENARYYLGSCREKLGKPGADVPPAPQEREVLPDLSGRRRPGMRREPPAELVRMLAPVPGAAVRSNEAWVSFELTRPVTAATAAYRATTARQGEKSGFEHVRPADVAARPSATVVALRPPSLVPGNRYDLIVRGKEADGSGFAVTNRGITCDNTPPTIVRSTSPSHPDSAKTYSMRTPTVEWEARDDLSYVTVYVLFSTNARADATDVLTGYWNGGATFAVDSYTAATALSPGAWYVHFVAVDAAGNISAPAVLSIRIGTTR
jgi:hypothetical protein